VFEGALAFGGEIFAATVLVEAQHLHGLAGAFGGDTLLGEAFGDLLCALFEEAGAGLGGVGGDLGGPAFGRWCGGLLCG